MEEYLKVGVITTTHGVRGEVKVYPTTDDARRFEELEEVFLDTGRERKVLKIDGVRYFKNLVILKFEGFDNINDIEKYKGCDLLVDRAHAQPLGENEYYIADLIGIKVYTEDGKEFGTIKDVLQTGANDVYCISSREHGEVLLPAIRQCILSVDVERQIMTVRLLDGLIQG